MKQLLTFFLILLSIIQLTAQANGIETSIDSLVYNNHHPLGPGIAVSVVKEGEVVYRNEMGYANLEYNIPITDSTVFHVASISKQFAVFAILLLEEEGKLSIDDSVKNYLSELKELNKGITIRQLANHTSGFRNTFDLANLKGIDNQDLIDQKEMVELLLRQGKLNFLPGSKYEYCNAGFVLLAEIVQRVTGQSFSEFTKERIFKPLKMRHTLFLDDLSSIVKNKAYSYSHSGEGYKKILLNRTVVGATGLNTTSHDLSLWAMNFDNPVVGNDKIFKKMKTQSLLTNGKKISYALGQEIKSYKGLNVVFHGGGDAGYRAYLLRVPAHQFSVVVMGNLESFNPLDISYGILDLYLSEFCVTPPKKAIPKYSNEDLKIFEGDYQVFSGLYITLISVRDTLYFQPFGTKEMLPLPVLGEGEFSFPYAPHSKIVFNDLGLKWHFSDFAYLGKKVKLVPPVISELDMQEYMGVFRSAEIETSYTIVIADDELIATHSFNEDIILRPLEEDTFITDSAFFSRAEYIRDATNQIIGCEISGQNALDVWFEKME